MFITNFNMGFSIILVVFSFITISFNSLFFTWVFMELNLLMVSPLLLMKTSYSKEQPSLLLKYFLVQVIGSMFILLSLTLNSYSVSPPMFNNVLLIMAMVLKAGLPPLHFWFPPIMALANPYQGFILLCVQKIIPLFLISILSSESLLMTVMLSSLVGGVAGMSQNSLMKIMAYSSMVHSGWMISGMSTLPSSGYFYFAVYSVVTGAILMILQKFKIAYMSELVKSAKSLMMKTMVILMVFTLSGIPPFIGFFSKAYVIKSLMSYNFYMMILFLLVGSSLSFFFYTRMVVTLSLFNFVSPKETYQSVSQNYLMAAILASVSVLTIMWALV